MLALELANLATDIVRVERPVEELLFWKARKKHYHTLAHKPLFYTGMRFFQKLEHQYHAPPQPPQHYVHGPPMWMCLNRPECDKQLLEDQPLLMSRIMGRYVGDPDEDPLETGSRNDEFPILGKDWP